MVVVSMTSWLKRIGYVKKVVESIMNNTVQPDRVYLNLSKTEFDGYELPEDLVSYFNSDERLVINWIEGENTKSMKKIFPILQYLEDDDFVIDADDDKLFPSDLIESRLSDFEKNGKKYPITSNRSRCGIGEANVISPMTLFQKKMLNNWDKFVDSTVIHTYNDDRTYLYILYLNGYVAKGPSKYTEKELNLDYDLHLSSTSMRTAKLYPIGGRYDEIVKPTVYKLTHNTIANSFGFFQKKKYDCVMVYGKSGIDSKEMTCGDHLEIEYVIASLKKYCSSWCGRIFVVGSEPPSAIKNDVIHIVCDNPYKHCKDANIIHKLRYACEYIPDLTDDFLMLSDDQIVTKISSWEDMKPRYVRRYNDWTEEKWKKNMKMDFWHECLYRTMKLFPKDKACFWEPHIWSPMNKYKFVDMCKTYDYKHNISCITLSLYYNYIKQTPVKGFDHTHMSANKTSKILQTLTKSNVTRHLSWTDTAFAEVKFRNLLDEIVGFNNENEKRVSHYQTKPVEKKTPTKSDVSKIKQLREDIITGRVVKVATENGFIWKRVK